MEYLAHGIIYHTILGRVLGSKVEALLLSDVYA